MSCACHDPRVFGHLCWQARDGWRYSMWRLVRGLGERPQNELGALMLAGKRP